MKTNLPFSAFLLAMLITFSIQSKAQTGYFGHYFIHTASAANNDFGDGTILNDASINGDQSKVCIFAGNYGIYNDFNLGIWYYSTSWDIYRETGDTIPYGSMYNVMAPTAHGTSFVHTAATATISSNYTVIDNAALNGNPNKVLIVNHIYNPLGGTSNYCNHPIGVWYNGSKWTIYTEDNTNFPDGTTFNVFATDSSAHAYVHVATAANTNQWITRLDNPLLNGNPNAVIFATHNLVYNGGTNIYDNGNVGVWYNGSKWTVYNQHTSDSIPYTMAFNIVIANDAPTGVEEVTNDNIYNMMIYPNPSASSSNIRYDLKSEATVDIKLFNSLGEEVSSVYNGKQAPGIYALPVNMESLAGGIYFCRLSVDGRITTKAIVKQ